MVKAATKVTVDPRDAATAIASDIIARYSERMAWGDRKGEMSWVMDLKDDIVAAILGETNESK